MTHELPSPPFAETKMRFGKSCLVLSLILVPGLARGEPAEEHDFPLRVEEAYTQKRNQLQLTPSFGFTRGKSTEREIDEDGEIETETKEIRALRTHVEMEYGITDRLEAELEFAYRHEQRKALPANSIGQAGSFEDMELGLRYRLMPGHGDLPVITVGYALVLPTGSEEKELGARNYGHELGLAASRNLGNWVGHLNLGAGVHFNETRLNEDGSPSPARDLREISYGAGLVYRIGEAWALHLELSHEIEEEIQANERVSESELVILPGFSVGGETELGGQEQEWALGLGFPVGLTDDAPDWGILVRLKYEFDLWGGRTTP